MVLPRIAFVTIGQAPRDDVVPELLSLLDEPGTAARDQFGALDGLPMAEIARHPPGPREGRLYTRLQDGTHVVVGAGFVARRLETLLRHLDGASYDLIVLITTGVFQKLALRTPLVHGQQAVDSWISALVMGDCELGVIYPLAEQHRPFAHGTLIQNAHAVAATGETPRLEDAAGHLTHAHLILMHSVGYTEAMARHVAETSGRPVVTARRIIAGAIRLHLDLHQNLDLHRNEGTRWTVPPPSRGTGPLIDRLPEPLEPLTPRERDVVAAMLDGEGNKAIGRRLGISHRTVEIHRARALGKLNAASVTELVRRALMAPHG